MTAEIGALKRYCMENGRVCPLPIPWDKLWNMLPDRHREGAGWEPPLPLILGAWAHSSTQDKRKLLQEHLQWAEQHGVLGEVDRFVHSLPEDQWLHIGEWPA
jgi:hypothetical protein